MRVSLGASHQQSTRSLNQAILPGFSRGRVVVRANADGPGPSEPEPPRPRRTRPKRRAPEPDQAGFIELNPIELGRRSREVFDDVWSRFSTLGLPSRGATYDEDFDDFRDESRKEFDTPQSRFTTVLVVGATGRVGKVLLRKLLLRGYRVKALVRPSSAGLDMIPRKVEVVEGDIADIEAVRKAVEGVNKVICCVGVSSRAPADAARQVLEVGVENLVRAYQDEAQRRKTRKDAAAGAVAPAQLAKKNIAKFDRERDRAAWKVAETGAGAREAVAAGPRSAFPSAKDTVEASYTEDETLKFSGVLYARGSTATVGADLESGSLAQCDAVLLRIRGDGQSYNAVLKGKDGKAYTSKFLTKKGFQTVRLPLSGFKGPNNASVRGEEAVYLGLKYDRQGPRGAVVDLNEAATKFALELEWVKASPMGAETDFILLSCAGVAARTAAVIKTPAVAVAAAATAGEGGAPVAASAATAVATPVEDVTAKPRRAAESLLKKSGLGYTIVRPGPLVEEPGGYRALVFDQGNRITKSISCADAADVCLRAMHEPTARNMSFEVCYEATAEEMGQTGMYELVAHLPDKSTNYLSLALSSLEPNM